MEEIFLPTGVENLDDILSLGRDIRVDTKRGIPLFKDGNGDLLETPILLIEGVTGVGKTTLALQIAFKIAKLNKDDTQGKKDDSPGNWKVYLYSIEQTKIALMHNAKNFGLINGEVEGFVDLSDISDENADSGKIRLCHFSPRPLEKEEDDYVFEQRKDELRHVLENISKKCKQEGYYPFFIIDSLTAFADRNLSRNEIYQLFQLFRMKNVPVIFTVEKYDKYTSDQDTISLECAKYLADIVIDLSTDSSNNYFKYQLEIIKSKVSRQAPGKHLYKIRTIEYAKNQSTKEGFVLYPSIQYVLSKVINENSSNPKDEFFICPENEYEKNDLYSIFNQTQISTDSCIAVVGPAGTHKLALAMNIAVSNMVNRNVLKNDQAADNNDPAKSKVLIVNFGSTSDFNFKGIAWTKQNDDCRNIENPHKTAAKDKVKIWQDEYGYKIDESKELTVSVTTFRMGHITAEECLNVIIKKVEEDDYSAVILTNTAKICTCFPELEKNSLFLPALIEIFSNYNIVSVCICVKTEHGSSVEDANLAILSKANYRIYLSHYPKIEMLLEKIVDKKNNDIKEQLVSLVVDNVQGKNYARAPKWLHIKRDENNKKTLLCSKEPILTD